MVFLQLPAITQKVWHEEELPKMFVLVAESAQRGQFHSGHAEHRIGNHSALGISRQHRVIDESKDIKRAARKVLQGWECCSVLRKGSDL